DYYCGLYRRGSTYVF
nr:immunoglobulin light chain junction region [Macaca mulatta]MOV95861.1 immunoglobulin light chain junction region [Macaca mulatta]MOV96543.1 immunoglobulin light chain junction region [Macaca mulatta]MOV99987.1 immunoglobulin light chain junction region [Macaca mulatta]MOW00848.1 immunoglobulin light chain junction region [Macaca mulatta]